MRKDFTDSDRKKIKQMNLFKIKNESFIIIYSVTILIYLYSFFYPYWGWRKIPINPPSTFDIYIEEVSEIQFFFLPLLIFSILNFFIKKIEIFKNYKTVKSGFIVKKINFFGKKQLLILSTYHLLFSKNYLKFKNFNNQDNVHIELTCFGRLIILKSNKLWNFTATVNCLF